MSKTSRTEPVRLWADVPAHERASEAMLRRRRDRSGRPYSEQRIQRILHAQTHPSGCPAAIQYQPWTEDYTGLWRPCGGEVVPRQQFCPAHGGLTFPQAAVVQVEMPALVM
jgi:hypothetical protein